MDGADARRRTTIASRGSHQNAIVSDINERDEQIVALVPCSYCAAAIGAWCLLRDGREREMLHAERLDAWRKATGAAPIAARDSRDLAVIAAVACEICEVPRSSPCVRYPGSTVVTLPHAERREAWQRARGPVVTDPPPKLCSVCGHGAGSHSSRGCYKCGCARSKHEIKNAAR